METTTSTATLPLSIVRVLSIVDSREYVEVGDKFVPVSGSGEIRSCDRCARDHEVHATVELSNGSLAIVGTGCARGESAEIVRALALGASKAKRVARLEAELAAARARLARWDAAAAEVATLEVPEIVDFAIERTDPRAIALGLPPIPAIACGDATHWQRTVATASRQDLADLVWSWSLRETSARSGISSRPIELVRILERKLDRATGAGS